MVENFLEQLRPLCELKQAKIYPGTTATEEQIAKWERRNQISLPEDYRQYLKQVGRCKLHGIHCDADHDFAVKLFALDDLLQFSDLAYGRDMDGIRDSWWGIADAQETNYIILECASIRGDRCAIVDGHSMIAHLDAPIIALSFSEFFERSLDDPDTSSGAKDEVLRYWSKGSGGYYGNVHDVRNR